MGGCIGQRLRLALAQMRSELEELRAEQSLSILNNLTDYLVEMIWDLKINLELRSELFVSASCSSGLTGECDPLEAGLVVFSAAV